MHFERNIVLMFSVSTYDFIKSSCLGWGYGKLLHCCNIEAPPPTKVAHLCASCRGPGIYFQVDSYASIFIFSDYTVEKIVSVVIPC